MYGILILHFSPKMFLSMDFLYFEQRIGQGTNGPPFISDAHTCTKLRIISRGVPGGSTDFLCRLCNSAWNFRFTDYVGALICRGNARPSVRVFRTFFSMLWDINLKLGIYIQQVARWVEFAFLRIWVFLTCFTAKSRSNSFLQ